MSSAVKCEATHVGGKLPRLHGCEGRMGTDTQGDRFQRSLPAQAVPVPWRDTGMGEMPLA